MKYVVFERQMPAAGLSGEREIKMKRMNMTDRREILTNEIQNAIYEYRRACLDLHDAHDAADLEWMERAEKEAGFWHRIVDTIVDLATRLGIMDHAECDRIVFEATKSANTYINKYRDDERKRDEIENADGREFVYIDGETPSTEEYVPVFDTWDEADDAGYYRRGDRRAAWCTVVARVKRIRGVETYVHALVKEW